MTDGTPQQRRKRRRAVVAGSLVAVILATGSAAIALAHGKGATSRPPAITGFIHLKQRDVQSGRTVRGELVFKNRTSKARVLLRGCKTDGLYAIGLRASEGYLQQPVFSSVGCAAQELLAKPGQPSTASPTPADYDECSQSAKDQPPKGSKYWTPLCLKDSSGQREIMPPLPPGTYTALFFPDGEWHGPHVKSADLVVTSTK